MPRAARVKSRTGIYHVMLRGINRQTIFEEVEDKGKFLDTLRKYKGISKYELYAYCLMDNHIHLLIKEQEESISVTIKRISSSYVYWYNTKYERCGHLFQDRFKSEKIETKLSFLRVLRYIHQNPIKAGLAKTVFDPGWTSIEEYLGTPYLVTIDKGLELFHPERGQALQLFTTYMVEEENNEESFMENQGKMKVSDCQLKEYLQTLGYMDTNRLQQLEKEERDAILFRLKELKGVSVRQISRITGISKSVIHRIGH